VNLKLPEDARILTIGGMMKVREQLKKRMKQEGNA
jgi:hypothetical protein